MKRTPERTRAEQDFQLGMFITYGFIALAIWTARNIDKIQAVIEHLKNSP